MDELCNQSIGFKEEIEELEMELKKSMAMQLEHLKKEIKQEIQDSVTTAKMNDNLGQLPQQLSQMKEYMSKTVLNLHHQSMHSDITVVNTFRELFESKTPDSNMMWNKVICKDDPTYQFRGRWRQLAYRLNYIANYAIRAGLLIPITGSKYADDLRTMAELLIKVMKKMFYQEGVLEHDDLLDIEGFALFQETVSGTMQLQAISANQVCNFIQQILYYNQCTHQNKSLDFLNYKSELDILL